VFGFPVVLKLYWRLFVCLAPSSYKTHNHAWTSVATLHLLGFPFFTLLGMVGGEKWLALDLQSHQFLDAFEVPQKFK